jgi:hypothetical protein
MGNAPQFPRDRIREEIDRLFQEQRANTERQRGEKEKRKKAYLDGAAIGIALLAAAFTGWQGWEAHETRKEAAQSSAQSLQVSQRAYIGVEGVAASDGSPQLVIRTFGNSPALNVFIESNCYIDDFSRRYTGGPVVKPEGEILSPEMPYKLECDRVNNKAPTPPNAAFQYLKGTVNYKDIFRQSHTTNFCFFRDERPGEHLHVCDTGNSLD